MPRPNTSTCTARRSAPWRLRVDDAARTLDRARALLCPDWQEPIGAGERRIPAVRAPDGTLVYLVQPEANGRSFWEDDFDLLPVSAK